MIWQEKTKCGLLLYEGGFDSLFTSYHNGKKVLEVQILGPRQSGSAVYSRFFEQRTLEPLRCCNS